MVVLSLIILSVTVALLNQEDEDILLAEDTPEGIVQRYLIAIEAGDLNLAYGYLGDELETYCTYSLFRDSISLFEGGDTRVHLESIYHLDGEVEVVVRITRLFVDPPFSSTESSYTARYTLGRDGEAWRFTAPPYPIDWCPGLEKGRKSVAVLVTELG